MVSRRFLAAVALASIVLTSGCLGVLTGSKALTFESQPAAADPSVASNAGYATDGTRTVEVNRTFTVAGQERDVVASNHVTTYEKKVDLGLFGEAKLGVFSVVSTPAVEIAGQTLNPIGDYSNDQLVGLIKSQYEGLSDVREVSSRQIQMLGQTTTVTKYSATARVSGQTVDVYVHVTKVRDGDDFVLAFGLYPQRLSGEESNVLELMRSVDHPAEA